MVMAEQLDHVVAVYEAFDERRSDSGLLGAFFNVFQRVALQT